MRAGIVMLWLLSTAPALYARGESPGDVAAVLAESACYWSVIAAVLRLSPLRSRLAALEPWRRAALAAFLLALVGGNLCQRPALTYPFVDWHMFTRPVPPGRLVVAYTYEGVAPSGSRWRIWPTRLFPSLGDWILDYRLIRLVNATVAGDATSRARLEELLRAIGREHNRQHPRSPIASIVVVRVTIASRPNGWSPPSREAVFAARLIEAAP